MSIIQKLEDEVREYSKPDKLSERPPLLTKYMRGTFILCAIGLVMTFIGIPNNMFIVYFGMVLILPCLVFGIIVIILSERVNPILSNLFRRKK